jgi:hypothetical protein
MKKAVSHELRLRINKHRGYNWDISTALNHFEQWLDQKVLGYSSIAVCISMFKFNWAIIHIQLTHFQLTEFGSLMIFMTNQLIEFACLLFWLMLRCLRATSNCSVHGMEYHAEIRIADRRTSKASMHAACIWHSPQTSIQCRHFVCL